MSKIAIGSAAVFTDEPDHRVAAAPGQFVRPRRRWYQFTLRQFFVAVAMIGVVSALVGRNAMLADQQRLAVEALLVDQSFDVEYGEGWGESVCGWLPESVVDFLSPDFFRTVKTVRCDPGFCATPAADIDNLAILADLSEIETLALQGHVTDGAVLGMPDLHRLSHLTINGEGVSDAAISRIIDFERLVRLDLSYTRITDRGVDQLRNLPELEELNLSNTRITIGALHALSRLPKLARLDVSGCEQFALARDPVRGSPSPPSDFSQLTEFVASDTPLDDTAVEYLSCMPHLEKLDLCRTPVTDAVIPKLVAFRNLRGLRIGNTLMEGTTLDGLAALLRLESLDLGIRMHGLRYYRGDPAQFPWLGDEIIAKLTKLTQIRSLDLTNLQIRNDQLTPFAALPRLEELFVSWGDVPRETALILRNLLP